MKKTFLLFVACLLCVSRLLANEILIVNNVILPQNGEAIIAIDYTFDTQFKGYQLDIELGNGVELVNKDNGKPWGVNGFTNTDHTVSSNKIGDGKYRFVVVSMTNSLLPSSGTLLKVKVKDKGEYLKGNVITGKVTATEFTTTDLRPIHLDDIAFNITIGEPGFSGTILDENSTTAPTASDGAVNVQVKRTIYGNEWGTICLPFAMTAEQKAAAFGEDVILADYDSYEASDETDDDDNPVSLTVNFTRLSGSDGVEANHPYIIKTSKDITDFIVENVTIDPQDVEKGTKRKGRMYGNYVAGFTVPKENLFISGNKFWYSVGKTTMKGFRCYFELPEVISSYYNESSSAKINILFNDVSTGISNVGQAQDDDSNVYSLDGKLVSSHGIKSLPKGIYIKNGKKIIIK